MLDIPGFSENITKQYITQFGESKMSNSKVVGIIKSSEYIIDLNYILSTHKIVIDEVFIDKLVYYKPINTTIYTWDGMVTFTIKPM